MKFIILFLISGFSIAASAECTNFDGLWQGRCSNNNGNIEWVEWNIVQDSCEGFRFNRIDFVFGEVSRYKMTSGDWRLRIEDRFSFDKNNDSLKFDRWQTGYNRWNRDRMWAEGKGSLDKLSENRIRLNLDMRYEYASRPGRFWYEYNTCRLERM